MTRQEAIAIVCNRAARWLEDASAELRRRVLPTDSDEDLHAVFVDLAECELATQVRETAQAIELLLDR